jgi:hypothetical protein
VGIRCEQPSRDEVIRIEVVVFDAFDANDRRADPRFASKSQPPLTFARARTAQSGRAAH